MVNFQIPLSAQDRLQWGGGFPGSRRIQEYVSAGLSHSPGTDGVLSSSLVKVPPLTIAETSQTPSSVDRTEEPSKDNLNTTFSRQPILVAGAGQDCPA